MMAYKSKYTGRQIDNAIEMMFNSFPTAVRIDPIGQETYELEGNKSYWLKTPKLSYANKWKADVQLSVNIPVSGFSISSQTVSLPLPDYDSYSDGIRIRILGFTPGTPYTTPVPQLGKIAYVHPVNIIYEVSTTNIAIGERKEYEVLFYQDNGAKVDSFFDYFRCTSILAYGVTEAFLYSTDGTLYGESAYDLAVKYGFEGTEQEWLESIITRQQLEAILAQLTARIEALETALKNSAE